MVFIGGLPGAEAFKPCKAGDQELSDWRAEAKRSGVNIKALPLFYNP